MLAKQYFKSYLCRKMQENNSNSGSIVKPNSQNNLHSNGKCLF